MLQINAKMLELLEKDFQEFQRCLSGQRLLFSPFKALKTHNNNEKLSLVMQQIMMGLPVEIILQSYPDLTYWVNQLLPIVNAPFDERQTNVTKQKFFRDVLLSVQYNLIILNSEKAIVVNWSIKESIPQADEVKRSWETQAQLFLLAETENLEPNNISIINYFFNSNNSFTSYQHRYCQKQYESFKQKLEETLGKLPNNSINDLEHLTESSSASEVNLQKLRSGELTIPQYLETVEEVEI